MLEKRQKKTLITHLRSIKKFSIYYDYILVFQTKPTILVQEKEKISHHLEQQREWLLAKKIEETKTY